MSALPREIRELAIGRRIPTMPLIPGVPRHLCQIAFGHARAAWGPIDRSLCRHDGLLHGARLRYVGEQAYAVGRLRRLDSAAGAYYVAIDGEVLQHQGRPLLFSSAERAQRATSLAAASLGVQRLCAVIATIMSKPPNDIDDLDVAAFDAATKGCRGAVRVAAAEWAGWPIAFPITANLTAKARAIIDELLKVGLNRPVASGGA